MKVVQVAAEIFPFVKTGGLADVIGALPQALGRRGADVRLLLPGLPPILDAMAEPQTLGDFGPLFGAACVRLLVGRMPSGLHAYAIDAPLLYSRAGNPYLAPDGHEWPDNLQRFALLGWVAARLASGELDAAWKPEVMHAHDWHAAMSCAYLQQHPPVAAKSVFTIHNLAYQGLFAHGDFHLLGLPSRFMMPSGIEYHHQVSFMKAGLKYARRVTTVSPTYAREIATPEFGCGLDGVIRARGSDVSGILNGVDREVWDPARDPALASSYSASNLDAKAPNKAALQRELGLERNPTAPLFVVVSRLTPQKGLDLMLAALPALVQRGAQFALQGEGVRELDDAFRNAAAAHPAQIAVRIGYDEERAHRLIAGGDVIVVPSRFEPCGLTQLYGLRYGTLPLVRRVGGLADTVVDVSTAAFVDHRATGFAFESPTAPALEAALHRAIALYSEPSRWRRVMGDAMAQDFSWDAAAARYVALYRS